MARTVIAITGPRLDAAVERQLGDLGQQLRYVDLSAGDWSRLDGAWAYVSGGPEIVQGAESHLPPSVEFFCFMGTGYHGYVDPGALRARGITTTYTPFANARSVAEFAVGLLIMGMRRVPKSLDQMARSQWSPATGRSLYGATVGIVGFGHVGSEVARLLVASFGVVLKVWNRTDRAREIEQLGATPASLEEIFATCSAVSLHADAPRDSVPHLITEALLRTLVDGAVIANTARAGLFDPEELKRVLTERPDVAVLSDVYFDEPVHPDTDRWGLLDLGSDRFLLTLHMGYLSDDSEIRAGAMLLANVQAVLNGEAPPNPL